MIEKTQDITTKDGEMETFICHPERNGPFSAVFLLMDAHSIREELKDMARRLGTVGYYVLLPNLYYCKAELTHGLRRQSGTISAWKCRCRQHRSSQRDGDVVGFRQETLAHCRCGENGSVPIALGPLE
jgi:dienelactone hydrolase